MRGGDFFLDTNVVAYAFDPREPDKRETATELMERAENGRGCISFQVVQEFINVAQNKFRPILPAEELRLVIQDILIPICRVFPGSDFYLDALDTQQLTRFSWYDCLILQAAVNARCDTLYSEDFQDGFQYRGLTVKNPFK